MSTATDEWDEQATSDRPLKNEELATMPHCTRCKLVYIPSRSTSELKLTYCSFLCELGDLGFSISGLEHMQLVRKEQEPFSRPAEAVTR
jgi:hypothetical protein